MSFANYLARGTNVPILSQVELAQEPNDLGDSSRVGDAITYESNATYPLVPPTTSTLTPLETSFVPLFQVGLSSEDYLNVALPFNPSSLPQGASELGSLDYYMYVLGNSTPRFNLRYAVYDASLNRVQAYQTLTYDPSNNPYQSPLISSLEIKGFKIQYPPTAQYGFIEAQNIDGSGSLAVQFAYANSTIQLSYDTNVSGGSYGSTNIFGLDFGDYNADTSGLEPQIQANTANIVVLQGDVATLDTSVNALASSVSALPATIASKLPLAGGTMSGAINMGTFGITNVASPSASTDVATKAYVDAQTGGGAGGALPIAGGTMAGVINMNNNDISGLPNVPVSATSATSRTYVLSQLDGYLPLTGIAPMTGAISMGANKIGGLATPTLSTDATNKSYVDGQDALSLPLTGGALTGNLSTTGDITCATLNYTTLNPPVAGSSANIAQVLAVGNDAGGLNITNVGTLSATNLANPNPSSYYILTATGTGTTSYNLLPRAGVNNVFYFNRSVISVGSGTANLVLPPITADNLGTTLMIIVSGTGNVNYGVNLQSASATNDAILGIASWTGEGSDPFSQVVNPAGGLLYAVAGAGTSIPLTSVATTNDQNLKGLFANYWGDFNYNGNFTALNGFLSAPHIIRLTAGLSPYQSTGGLPNPCWIVEALANGSSLPTAQGTPVLPNNPALGTP